MQDTVLSIKNDCKLVYSSDIISVNHLDDQISKNISICIKSRQYILIQFIISTNQNILFINEFMENLSHLFEEKESIILNFMQNNEIKDNHCKIKLYYKG